MEEYSCQLLNLHGVNDVRHTENNKVDPIVTSSFQAEIVLEKLRTYKSTSTN
jgi:hypothetical protein